MVIIRGHQQIQASFPRAVVSIGNFDGMHLGHQQILAQNKTLAKKNQGTSVVYTFRPHPQVALRPERQLPLLCTYDEKLDLIAGQGIDVVIEEPFSREFSTTSSEEFFNQVLLRKLSTQAVVVGYDFAFGKGREGSLDQLSQWSQASGVELIVVPPFRLQGEVVSSSRIRQHLNQGEIESANQLLGRCFSYRGVVVRGDGRGRLLGFPTANLKLENKIALPHGVYATWAQVGDKRYPSVTNVGVRPTFKQAEGLPALVETHVINETIDLYGSTLEVAFVERLRAEKKFSSVEELKTQIEKDRENATQLLLKSSTLSS